MLAAAAVVAVAAPSVLASQGPVEVVDQYDVTDAAAPGGLLDAVLFYTVAASTVIAAMGVCISKNIVRMAVWLFITLGSVALLFFLLAATFLGAIQLIVYVGGTLILLVFGVMLTSKSPWVRFETSKIELAAAGGVCAALLISLCLVFARTVWPEADGVVPGSAVADIGTRLGAKCWGLLI
jgi:NADH:ubiquinone oxidoreductase subunit 6 (subunit J)